MKRLDVSHRATRVRSKLCGERGAPSWSVRSPGERGGAIPEWSPETVEAPSFGQACSWLGLLLQAVPERDTTVLALCQRSRSLAGKEKSVRALLPSSGRFVDGHRGLAAVSHAKEPRVTPRPGGEREEREEEKAGLEAPSEVPAVDSCPVTSRAFGNLIHLVAFFSGQTGALVTSCTAPYVYCLYLSGCTRSSEGWPEN